MTAECLAHAASVQSRQSVWALLLRCVPDVVLIITMVTELEVCKQLWLTYGALKRMRECALPTTDA